VIVLPGTMRLTNTITFSPDATTLAVTGETDVEVWRLPAGELAGRWTFGHPYRLAFTPTGHRLYVSYAKQTNVINVETQLGYPHPEVPGPSWFAFTREGGFLLVSHGEDKLSRYELDTNGIGGLVRVWTLAREGSRSAAVGGGVCQNGSQFIAIEDGWAIPKDSTSLRRNRLVVRSTANGEQEHAAGWICEPRAFPLVVNPNGEYVVAINGMKIVVWGVEDPIRNQRYVKNDSKKHFTGIAFHPSGKYLAATSNDETVKLYDTTTWEVAHTFTWDIGRMRSIAFSPDGTLAAAGSDKGKVVVWDVDL